MKKVFVWRSRATLLGVLQHVWRTYNSLGTASTFVLEVDPEDTEIYFSRPNGGYELVLIKADSTGEWVRPNK